MTRAPRGVRYVSLHEDSGYGVAADRYVHGLLDAGVPVTWTPLVPGHGLGMGYEPFTGRSVGHRDLDEICNRDIPYDVVVVHAVPEYFPVFRALEPDVAVVGYTVWETSAIPPQWVELLESVDGLMVPTDWNREVFRTCGVTVPIDVVPHIVPADEPRDDPRWGDLPDDHMVFYTVNTWTARKALWLTIRAFRTAFGIHEPVTLVVKTSERDFTWLEDEDRGAPASFHGQTAWSVLEEVRQSPGGADVRVVIDHLTRAEMLGLHHRGDCFVSLGHGEGWGLGGFDAASWGIPVVVTGYGAAPTWLPAGYPGLVPYEIVPVDDRAGQASYGSDQEWGEPDLDAAVELLRSVRDQTGMWGDAASLAASAIAEQFSAEAVSARLVDVLAGVGPRTTPVLREEAGASANFAEAAEDEE